MKFISWNIDSLNAALTSDSNRAQMSRDVLATIQTYEADVIAIQETKLSSKGPTKKHQEALADWFPGYRYAWVSSVE
ncbi:endonuclease/exonuclease/phosphatase family protein, partial [Aerococcus sp. UMB9870]|nr:exodeoxyribonuclease [Aerococcus sp. UMB9870]